MDIITGHRGVSHVTSQNQRDINMGFVGEESYILPVGGGLAATITGGSEVTIADGVLMMQGCAASIGYGQSETLTLQAGTAGYKRYDLICAQYTKDSSGVESVSLVAKTGTPTTGTAQIPSYTEGNIAAGDTLVEVPLYAVFFSGAVISRMFKQVPTSKSIGEVLEWSASPVYQGYDAVFAFGDSNIHEMIVSVNVASTAWVNFPIPALDFDGRSIVNLYGSSYDGYVKVTLGSDGLQLTEVYNGTTRVTNPIWKVYYR